MTDHILINRAVVEQALEALEYHVEQTRPIWKTSEAIAALEAALAQAEPVAFDPAEAMRLADEYAYAQSELDGEHSVNRLYYVESRNEARAKLAAYLGIKGGGNG